MRCPNCQFVSADVHDLCQKCHSDLRPHKKLSGLTITDEAAGYDELLRRAGIDPSSAPPPNAAEPGFLSSLFRRTPATPPAPAAQSRPSAELQAPPPLVEPATSKPPPPSSVATVTAPNSPPPHVEEPAPQERPQPAVAPAPVPPKPPPPLPRSSIFRPASPEFDPVELDLAFDDAQAELRYRGDSGMVELTAESMLDLSKDKSAIALFDLAFEVLQNPELEHTLIEKVKTSDERKIESKDLRQELAYTERKMSLPVFGLRSLQARAESARQAERAEPTRELKSATLPARFTAWAIDLLTTVVLAICGAVTLVFVLDREWLSAFNSRPEVSPADAIAWAGIITAAALLLLVLYPLFMLLSGRRTLGQRMLRLRLVTELGRKVRLSHIVVRCLLYPLSLFCFGYLPALIGRRPLHDALARTKLCEDT